jgi:hypothetical protein
MTYLRQAAIAVVASMLSISAQASELPPLLEVALQKGEAADQIRWAFTSSFENNNASLTFRFEPRGEEGFFTLIAPESLNQDGEAVYARLTDEDDPDSDLTHEQARAVIGEQSVEIVAESEESITYAVRPNPWDDIPADQAAFMSHMMAELTVSKSLEQVSQLRLYNHEPFHARVVARIDRFEQVMTFAPEPVTGLPLMISLRQEVEGRALFQRILQIREETYRDFQPVQLVDGGEVSCVASTCIQEFLNAQ